LTKEWNSGAWPWFDILYRGTAVLNAAFCSSSASCQLGFQLCARSKATFSFEILLDCVLLDFNILHDSLEALDGIVQAGDDARWRKLCESEKQHQAERLDIVVVGQRVQNTLDECREIDLVEAGAELSGQYTVREWLGARTIVYLYYQLSPQTVEMFKLT
jgi:hypothetical protein